MDGQTNDEQPGFSFMDEIEAAMRERGMSGASADTTARQLAGALGEIEQAEGRLQQKRMDQVDEDAKESPAASTSEMPAASAAELGSLLILSATDVAKVTSLITPEALARMIGETMHAITASSSVVHDPEFASDIQNPARIKTETTSHRILYMPSRLTTATIPSSTAVKIVAVPKPSATTSGLPATTLLFDEATGACKAVVNAGELTGLRTAAASALATLLLADPESQTLVIFGNGTQAFYHARLILSLFRAVTSCFFIVRKPGGKANAVISRLGPAFPTVNIRCVPATSTSEYLGGADIVCCCVPSTSPIFDAKDLKPGVHINAIGSYTPAMQEFPPSLISSSRSSSAPHIPTILVDSRSACLAEAGELIAAGIQPSALVELGELINAQGEVIEGEVARKGLRSSGRSLFKCVGVGGMDVAVTGLVVSVAESMRVGTRVPL